MNGFRVFSPQSQSAPSWIRTSGHTTPLRYRSPSPSRPLSRSSIVVCLLGSCHLLGASSGPCGACQYGVLLLSVARLEARDHDFTQTSTTLFPYLTTTPGPREPKETLLSLSLLFLSPIHPGLPSSAGKGKGRGNGPFLFIQRTRPV